MEAGNPHARGAGDNSGAGPEADQAELARAHRQRDYLLRLLRQQQTLSARRRRHEAFMYYYEALLRVLEKIPLVRKVLPVVPPPARIEQIVKRIGVGTI